MSKFYTFIQNNSGGSFDKDNTRGIGDYVIIEAQDDDDANLRAESIGLYFDGVESGSDCECCGDRWCRTYKSSGTETPTIYGKPADKVRRSWSIPSFIHYLDGRIVEIPDSDDDT